MGAELDQVVNLYRTKLKQIAELWTKLTRHEKYDPLLVKATEEAQEQVEISSAHFMEQQLATEKARQKVRNLKQVLDVTRQIVEAKTHHVRTAEQQLEEEQSSRLREFQRIHKIEEDKVEIDKTLEKTKSKLEVVMEKLTRKCTTHRYLEDFTECLLEQLSQDLQQVKEQAESARRERSVWDRFDVDVLQEVQRFPYDEHELKTLHASVQQMKESLKNQNRWYEDELQTKLLYSSRNKEIQNKITHLKTVIKRMERSGRSEERDDCKSGGPHQSSDDFTTKAMVDGIADIQAKDVEDFLSHQFGIRVMADYSMLRRLKEEIGVVGLAYLVERIRFQELFIHGAPKSHRTFKDLEENKIEVALRTIAMEYRAHDELFKPWPPRDDKPQTQMSDVLDDSSYIMESPRQTSVLPSPSGYSSPTGSTTIDTVMGAGFAHRQESNSSLKSKSSMSRFKKMFKF